ncbi:glycosyltransferase [Candidatus Microthrix parvicella]|uniref:glycosyltransferase n=1 Tax=Candidatus Neomicrothrix parvicella TaxID=41950 RepID=UPI0003650B5C|nr:glycosyltransferase [Candidatus Microthrix parvicella]
MRPLKVLWVAKGLGPGGMERLLVHHARTGDHERFEYHAAYLVDRPSSVVAELEELGVGCTQLEPRNGSDPRWIRDLTRLVRDREIDVVHHHSPQPAAMSRPALRAMRGGPHLVYTEHNTWDCYGTATRAANALTYHFDEAQFAVSESVQASVPKVLRRGLEPLTHGIDLGDVRRAANNRDAKRESLGISPDQIVVANIAHLRREKAQDVLMSAAAELVGEFDNVTFISVGHGPMEDDLAALHTELGLGDRFRFLGFREDAVSVLAGSDVFCLSSRQEGLPVAFMEACALGVPAVTTNVGGLPEHIQHGRSGLLVAPEDSTALAVELGRMIADSGLRRRLGVAAAAHAEVFDARVAVKRQEVVYERLITGRPRQ